MRPPDKKLKNLIEMEPPQIGDRQVVYENQYQQVYQVRANFHGFAKEYFVTDYGRRAGLVVVRGESVLLVRQYRLLINRVSWEIPGGSVDSGETPEAAAVRECLEETGVQCCNLKPLLFFHPGLDTLQNPTYLFYTGEFGGAMGENLHAHEVIQHHWVPLDCCIEMIFGQQIVDSLSIVGLLAYRTLTDGRSS